MTLKKTKSIIFISTLFQKMRYITTKIKQTEITAIIFQM